MSATQEEGTILFLYVHHLSQADNRKSRQSKLNPLVGADWLDWEEKRRVRDMMKSRLLQAADHAIERVEQGVSSIGAVPNLNGSTNIDCNSQSLQPHGILDKTKQKQLAVKPNI